MSPTDSGLAPADRLAVLELLAAHSHGYDGRDWDLYRSLWTEDAVLTNGDVVCTGRAAIEERARARREMLAGKGIQTRHYQTNTLFDAVGADRVRTRTILMVAWQHAGRPAPELVHTGIYRDEFVRTAGGWKMARRSVEIDHE